MIWEKYKEVNDKLYNYGDLFSIPPYRQCMFVKYLDEILAEKDRTKLSSYVSKNVMLPYIRSNQIERRYKYCSIFSEVIPVLEYASYNAFSGDYICSYLSLIPVVEAVLQRWAKEQQTKLSFLNKKRRESISNFLKGFRPYLKEQTIYNDRRKNISDGFITYLTDILDIFYANYDKYNKKNIPYVFNRNFTLHKLFGVCDLNYNFKNISRIFLILDIMAELYICINKKLWEKIWKIDFNGEYSLNVKLREALYKKRAIQSVTKDDLLIIHNAFIENIDDKAKEKQLSVLNMQIEMILKRNI